MKKTLTYLTLFVSAWLIGYSLAQCAPTAGSVGTTTLRTNPTEGQWLGGVLGPNDLHYLGSFRIPTVYGAGNQYAAWGFSRGGELMAYSTDDDGAPDQFVGSLWVSTEHLENQGAGLNQGGRVGRFSIPTPSTNPDFNAWPEATLLDPAQDFGHDYVLATGQRCFMGGGLWHEGWLFSSAYEYYNGNADDKDHLFYAPTTVLGGAQEFGDFDSVSALQHVGPHTSPSTDWVDKNHSMKHGGYAFRVPNDWYTKNGSPTGHSIAIGQGNREGGHLTVNECVVTPLSIDGSGRRGCNIGPGFGLVHPDTLFRASAFATTSRELEVIECATYADDTCYVASSVDPTYRFTSKDQWVSMSWICNYDFDASYKTYQEERRNAIVSLVMDCEGDDHYYNSSSCWHDADCCGHVGSAGYVCGDSNDGGQCWRPELWFFNPSSYVGVWNGDPAYSPAPYAIMDLSPFSWEVRQNLICFHDEDGHGGLHMLSMTYDVTHSLLYIAEQGRSGSYGLPPFVMVFGVGARWQ